MRFHANDNIAAFIEPGELPLLQAEVEGKLVDVLFAPPQWQIKLEPYQKRRLLVYFGLDGAPRNATPAEKADFVTTMSEAR